MRRTTKAVARLGTLAVLAGTALATPLAIGTASATVSGITVTNGTIGSNENVAARDDYPNMAQVTFNKDTGTDNITLTLTGTNAYFPITQSDANVVATSSTSATCNANVGSCTVDIGSSSAESATLFIADITDATSQTATVKFNGIFITGCPGTGLNTGQAGGVNWGTNAELTPQNCVTQGQFGQPLTLSAKYLAGGAGVVQGTSAFITGGNMQFSGAQPAGCSFVSTTQVDCTTDASGNFSYTVINNGTGNPPAPEIDMNYIDLQTRNTTGTYPAIVSNPPGPDQLVNWGNGGVTPTRVNAVGGQVIAPTNQVANFAEPGDVIEGTFEVQGSCTPAPGDATCDDGTRLAGVQVTVSVDHGFITPNCTKAGVTAYAECTFATTPTAGSPVGNLANSGTSATFNTGVDGTFKASFAIGRDAGFDQNGRLPFHVTVADLSPLFPNNHTTNQTCSQGVNVLPAVGGGGNTQNGPILGGCPIDGAWSTDQQPLNGGTASIKVVPALQAPNNVVIPSENNFSATVGATTNVPDVDRVVYRIEYTDQFGNLTSNAGSAGADNAKLVKTGVGALYRCGNNFSSTSACTSFNSVAGGGTIQPDGTSTQTFTAWRTNGSYLSVPAQRRWQADTTDPQSPNMNLGYGGLSGGAVPGVNDGTQVDTLTWTPPTTTFASYLAGNPAVATYANGNGPLQTVTITFNFYNQLAQPVVTFSVKPGSQVQTGTAVTVEANVLDQHGNPIVLQPVQFVRTGSNESSCVPIQDTNANNGVPTNAKGTSGYTFSCNDAGVSNVSIVVTGPGGIQLAQGREAVTFGGAVVGPAKKVEKPTLKAGSPKPHVVKLKATTHPKLKHVIVKFYKVKKSGKKVLVGSDDTNKKGKANLRVKHLKSGKTYKFKARVAHLSNAKYISKYSKVEKQKVD